MTNHILRVFHAVASAVSNTKSSVTPQSANNHHQPYDSVRALLEPKDRTVFDELRGMSRQEALQARPR